MHGNEDVSTLIGRPGTNAPPRVRATTCLEEKPSPPRCLVDPLLNQARAGDVTLLIAKVVGLAQSRREGFIVLAKFCKHIERLDIIGVVISDALFATDVAY